MATTTSPSAAVTRTDFWPPELHRLSVEDFQRMVDEGIIDAGDRVELLDGVIVEMSPEGPGHAAVIARINRLLVRGIADDALFVRPQSPLTFPDARSQPEPDLAVVVGNPTDEHPGTALLAIEVSVTTQRRDRLLKSGLYSAAGIPEYWLLDVPARTLEVRREPVGGVYRSIRILGPEDTVEPLQVPVGPVQVSGLLGS